MPIICAALAEQHHLSLEPETDNGSCHCALYERSYMNSTAVVPYSFEQLMRVLDQIFDEYGTQIGVEIRRRRYIWKTVIKK